MICIHECPLSARILRCIPFTNSLLCSVASVCVQCSLEVLLSIYVFEFVRRGMFRQSLKSEVRIVAANISNNWRSVTGHWSVARRRWMRILLTLGQSIDAFLITQPSQPIGGFELRAK